MMHISAFLHSDAQSITIDIAIYYAPSPGVAPFA